MRVLITGVAGFVGAAVALRLLERQHSIVGVDCLNDYYDVRLKRSRLERLVSERAFEFRQLDIADRSGVERLFRETEIDLVLHLAAQAGVRYSLTNPHAYSDSNLVGFVNVLEGCRTGRIRHLVFASSSSVYGMTSKVPFSEDDDVDHPISLYAATKRSNELLAYSYAHLYGIPCTGLRFFTVYGPWGRPDMAYFSFTKAIIEGQPIKIFNHGDLARDFTYIDDIVGGVVKVLEADPFGPVHSAGAPITMFNIGNHQPVPLMRFVEVLEQSLGKKAILEMLPMQPGDVKVTYADTARLQQAVGFVPTIGIEEGLPKFVAWYRDYYNV